MDEIILAILDLAIADREMFEAWQLKNEAVRKGNFEDAIKYRELEKLAISRLPTSDQLKELRQRFTTTPSVEQKAIGND